jgi:hypothetical protein
MPIEHGTSVEREIGSAKKKWKQLKAEGADVDVINKAKEHYKELKKKGANQQLQNKAEKEKVGRKDAKKYEKALRKKLKNIEILKLKVARWTGQKPNSEQQAKLARYDGLVQELIKLTKKPYIAPIVTADKYEKINTTQTTTISTTGTTFLSTDATKDYCYRFQVGKCPHSSAECLYLHEIKPTNKSTMVIGSGKKRKFGGDEDDDGEEEDIQENNGKTKGEQKDNLKELKANWKRLKENSADVAKITEAKKKYKKAKQTTKKF